MTRKCSIENKKGIQTGNNVSHSNRKTKRKFYPNIQAISLYSEILNSDVRMKLARSTIRSIEKRDGLDSYMISMSNSNLTVEGKRLKKRLLKAQEKKREAK